MSIIQELDFRNPYPKSSYSYRFNSDSLRTSSPRCQISLNVKGEIMNGITATFSAANQLDMFWLDPDFAMWHSSGDGTQWSLGEERLAGNFTSVPAAVASDTTQPNVPRRLDVFGLGPDYAMYHKRWEGTQWSLQWESLGSTVTSGPPA